MPARRLIERGNADEPMNARLRGEQAVRVLAGDGQGCALQAGFFAWAASFFGAGRLAAARFSSGSAFSADLAFSAGF